MALVSILSSKRVSVILINLYFIGPKIASSFAYCRFLNWQLIIIAAILFDAITSNVKIK